MPEDLLNSYACTYNYGVRFGDISELLDLFTDDASMSFHGLPRPFGPFHRPHAIAEAFAAHPPDDELVLDRIDAGEDCVRARYCWRAHPDAPGGRLLLRARPGRISELTITVEGELHP